MTNSISPYMKDGTPFVIRPCLQPGDPCGREDLKRQIANATRHELSPDSMWHRFATGRSGFATKELDHLTDIDGHDRVALCAYVGERGIGLARYIRLPENPGHAEFALTVIDQYHHQGVGHALMLALIDAARGAQLDRLYAYILPSNAKMLRLMEHLNAEITREDTFLRAEMALQW